MLDSVARGIRNYVTLQFLGAERREGFRKRIVEATPKHNDELRGLTKAIMTLAGEISRRQHGEARQAGGRDSFRPSG